MKTCSSCGGKDFNPDNRNSRKRHRAAYPQYQLAMMRGDGGRPQLDLTKDERQERLREQWRESKVKLRAGSSVLRNRTKSDVLNNRTKSDETLAASYGAPARHTARSAGNPKS